MQWRLAERHVTRRHQRERALERELREMLIAAVARAQYPRMMVSLTVLIAMDDGSAAAAAYNAAALALLDAGVEMNWLPISVSCALMPPDECRPPPPPPSVPADAAANAAPPPPPAAKAVRVLDPTAAEEACAQMIVHLTVCGGMRSEAGVQVAAMHATPGVGTGGGAGADGATTTRGSSDAELLACVDAAGRASDALLAFVRRVLQGKCAADEALSLLS